MQVIRVGRNSTMQYTADRIIFSPSDLITYLDGDYASWMDHWHLECRNGNASVCNELGLPLGLMLTGVSCEPDVLDDEAKLIAAKGQEHEAEFPEAACFGRPYRGDQRWSLTTRSASRVYR